MALLSFRLYPVIPANARVITDRDIQVGGYLIPKNVSVLRELVHFEIIHNAVWSQLKELLTGLNKVLMDYLMSDGKIFPSRL